MNIVEFTSLSNKPIRMIEVRLSFRRVIQRSTSVLLKKAVWISSRVTAIRAYVITTLVVCLVFRKFERQNWPAMAIFVGSGVFAYSPVRFYWKKLTRYRLTIKI